MMRGGRARDTQEVRSGVPEGAVRIVRETGKSIAHVARDLGVNEGDVGGFRAPGTEPSEIISTG